MSRAAYSLHTDENEILNKLQCDINVIKKLNSHIKKNTIVERLGCSVTSEQEEISCVFRGEGAPLPSLARTSNKKKYVTLF